MYKELEQPQPSPAARLSLLLRAQAALQDAELAGDGLVSDVLDLMQREADLINRCTCHTRDQLRMRFYVSHFGGHQASNLFPFHISICTRRFITQSNFLSKGERRRRLGYVGYLETYVIRVSGLLTDIMGVVTRRCAKEHSKSETRVAGMLGQTVPKTQNVQEK